MCIYACHILDLDVTERIFLSLQEQDFVHINMDCFKAGARHSSIEIQHPAIPLHES